ncbi:MAG: hypothetical protein RL632_266 [Bacteroidota bacterium]|jgi:hypothetical protein
MKTNFLTSAVLILGSITTVAAQSNGALNVSATKTDPTCYETSDGTISLDVVGGVAPYTFTWSNTESSSALTGLHAGLYDVTVHDALNDAVSLSFELLNPEELKITGVVTPVSMHGGSDGAIDVTVTGLAGGFDMLWSSTDGAGYDIYQFDQTNLTGGIYKFDINTEFGCSASATFFVDQAKPTLVPLGSFLTNTFVPEQKDTILQIMIYPNPSEGNFAFKNTDDVKSVSVYNSVGTLVGNLEEHEVGRTNHGLSLDSGIYSVVFERKNGTLERQGLVIR